MPVHYTPLQLQKLRLPDMAMAGRLCHESCPCLAQSCLVTVDCPDGASARWAELLFTGGRLITHMSLQNAVPAANSVGHQAEFRRGFSITKGGVGVGHRERSPFENSVKLLAIVRCALRYVLGGTARPANASQKAAATKAVRALTAGSTTTQDQLTAQDAPQQHAHEYSCLLPPTDLPPQYQQPA